MAEERLYSITEAAAKLGVSPATIATWIRLGIATASRQDELGRNRYTDADLVEMERRMPEPKAAENPCRAATPIPSIAPPARWVKCTFAGGSWRYPLTVPDHCTRPHA